MVVYGIIFMGNGGVAIKDWDSNMEHGISWFPKMGVPKIDGLAWNIL